MNREDKSEVLENILNPQVKKQAFFDRADYSIKKHDPFEEKADGNVWLIKGNKLLKNNKYKDNEKWII